MGFDTGKQKKTSDLEAARKSLLRFAGELKSASVAQVENDGDIIPEGVCLQNDLDNPTNEGA